MISKFILANVQQFVALAKNKTQLLDIGQFGSLRPALNAKGCNCGGGPKFDWSEYREKFELSLQLLGTEDMNKLKTILQAKEVCYNYRKVEGGIGLMCF